MSSNSITYPGSIAGGITLQSLFAQLTAAAKRLAFWTAIALPFLHVSLLTTGLETTETQVAFALLVLTNVCALLVGHPYDD